MNGEDLRKKYSFSNEDILQIKELGLMPSDVNKQLETYRRGPNFLKLIRPCIPGDGIRSFSAVERNRLIKRHNAEAAKHSILKFVPASGAASRMFAAWFAAAQQGSFGNTGLDRSFFADLRNKTAGIAALFQGCSVNKAVKKTPDQYRRAFRNTL